jgi:hypothetical protein
MMWQTGEPTEQGWYLCAWRMGVEYVYGVCKWHNNKWKPYPVGTPDTWTEIDSPTKQNETLDNLYEYAQ